MSNHVTITGEIDFYAERGEAFTGNQEHRNFHEKRAIEVTCIRAISFEIDRPALFVSDYHQASASSSV